MVKYQLNRLPSDNSFPPRRKLNIYPSSPQISEHGYRVYSPLGSEPSNVYDYGNDLLSKLTKQDGSEDKQTSLADDLRGIADESQDSLIGPGDLDSDLDDILKDGASNVTCESLKNDMSKAMEPDKIVPEKRFLPRKALLELCNFDTVFGLLQPIDPKRAKACAEFVCGPRQRPSEDNRTSCRQIFAILVLINRLGLIMEFYEARLRDDNLPLQGSEMQTELWSRHSDSSNPIKFLLHDGLRDVRHDFYRIQWWIHVPFLARDEKSKKAIGYTFEASTVMPWTFVSPEKEVGGFGAVQRVEIHPDHHAFKEYTSFALKTMLEDEDENATLADFHKEIAACRKIKKSQHAVELCATFRVGTQYMLLFPWAEGGSLVKLWTTEPPSRKPSSREFQGFMHWVAIQCHGLVKELNEIHGFLAELRGIPENEDDEEQDQNKSLYGIHGDFKPGNILHFSQDTAHHERGSLKIADFGLCEFHRKRSRTAHAPHAIGAADQTYRAPEHDSDQILSRKIDIWALGCVFSELLTWCLLGPNALEEYRELRIQEASYSGRSPWNEENFFVRGKQHWVSRIMPASLRGQGNRDLKKIKLKRSVSNWIDRLIRQSSTGINTFIPEFLTFIKMKMLETDRKARVECDEVEQFLAKCLDYDLDTGYWFSKE